MISGQTKRVATTRWATLLPAVVSALLFPCAALACPSCFSSSNAGVLKTYYLTAAFMTVLPLIMVGAFALWIYRRSKEADAIAEEAEPS